VRREKLKKDKEAWKAEKEELHYQLEEAHINIETERIASYESAEKAEQQGCQHGQEDVRSSLESSLRPWP